MSAVTRCDQAVILAAGLGSRIRGEAQPLPKPLVPVGGVPLLKRTLLTAAAGGVRRFAIVVGCGREQIQATIESDRDLAGLELVWVVNPRYDLKNGVSVLAARPHVWGEFYLMMSDHVLDAAIFDCLPATSAHIGLYLAVDRKLDTIFDMDDATKVVVGRGETIRAIGKQLDDFDAVDTGVFRCNEALFESLEQVYRARGDVSLSDGVQALALGGRARVADIGQAWWQDVDDRVTRLHAERLLSAGRALRAARPQPTASRAAV